MGHPFLKREFYISWSTLGAENVSPDIERGISLAREGIEEIVKISNPTYENTIKRMGELNESLSIAWRKVSHLNSLCSTSKFRAALNEMLPKISNFRSSVYLNSALWENIKKIESDGLTDIAKRHLSEVRASFVNNGAELTSAKKERFSEVCQLMAVKTQQFSDNVLDEIDEWDLVVKEEELLRGLPESAIVAARISAQEKDYEHSWRFTLQTPSRTSVLQHAQSEELRKQVWEAQESVGRRGKKNNLPLIVEILGLRRERARMLGFESFPDLVLCRRMAQNGKTALNFIEGLYGRIQKTFLEEIGRLEDWRALKDNREKQRFLPWDIAFWMEQMRAEEYGFDDEQTRPYLPITSVLQGMFELATELYGISIVERKGQVLQDGDVLEEGAAEVWHETVQVYDVFDEDDSFIGAFYTDWFPREGKEGGAWMEPLFSGGVTEDDRLMPNLGVICGNLTSPIGDDPALLKPREMQTIFHEFGHLLHHLLGTVKIPSLNGTNVAWDFVELPSQIMENWCWEPAVLQRFAFHYKTNEVIPSLLIKKMKRARNFLSAYKTMRQLLFAKLDLELHLRDTKWSVEILDEEIESFLEGYRIPMALQVPTLVARFGHLFGDPIGYAGGYYSYKWAEVLDADAYSRFKENGIFNKETGHLFRKTILSKGNSKPAAELFFDFMGREPDVAALLKRDGLA